MRRGPTFYRVSGSGSHERAHPASRQSQSHWVPEYPCHSQPWTLSRRSYASRSIRQSVHSLTLFQRARKPIYDAPPSASAHLPSPREVSATTPTAPHAIPITRDGIPTTLPSTADTPVVRNAPTDRLAAQIARTRLFIHGYAARAEDAVNNGMGRILNAEQSFTSTVASLAPPKESNERLLPGGIYVLVSAMAGSIVSRNRNILLRGITPLAAGVVAANYFIPRTTENVGGLIWKYESRFPVIRDNHLRVVGSVRHFIETGKAHSQMGLHMAEEKVQDARETLEGWVKQGR